MKTSIKVHSNKSVSVTQDGFDGERFTRTYFVATTTGSGYVKYQTADGNVYQICDGMSSTGSTLTATRDTLPAVLRRELRRERLNNRKGN